ncbi:hypothetical protein LshimejAT787_0904750 [Lyophyllum shimeji]|uniref:Uncharacterized protein n=1 Tax=Lyophyllum shimeji TaxID=47721 RepID=A0A9P3URF0_LYOSH|nr:hypothetical protein LshimejAT787_0904750 [Lyophyllum shimeji]
MSLASQDFSTRDQSLRATSSGRAPTYNLGTECLRSELPRGEGNEQALSPSRNPNFNAGDSFYAPLPWISFLDVALRTHAWRPFQSSVNEAKDKGQILLLSEPIRNSLSDWHRMNCSKVLGDDITLGWKDTQHPRTGSSAVICVQARTARASRNPTNIVHSV